MRIRLVALTAVGALVLAAVAGAMSTSRLTGTVGPGYTISLKSKSKSVKTLKKGKYTFVVSDKSGIHNFTLDGPGIQDKTLTGTSFVGTKTVTVSLKKTGSYKVYCTLHPFMVQKFKVS